MSIGLSWTFNGSYIQVWFCNIFWSHGNYKFFQVLTISKIILINITTKLIKNALEALEALKLMVMYIFHSSNFCLKRRVSSLAKKKKKPTNPVCFPWIDSLISFIFKKMSTRHLSLNSHSLSDVVSSKNGVLCKTWLVQLATQTIA